MWTPENRPRYNRNGLRYPSDLTDDEWMLIAPLIPSWHLHLQAASCSENSVIIHEVSGQTLRGERQLNSSMPHIVYFLKNNT